MIARISAARASLLVLLLAGSLPAAAAPSHLAITEVVRPVAGRPSEVVISGTLHNAAVQLLEGFEIVGQTVVVSVYVQRYGSLPDYDFDYAYTLELPRLPAGEYRVELRGRSGPSTPLPQATLEASATLTVDPAFYTPSLEPAGGGAYRLLLAGSGQGSLYSFVGPPEVHGDTLRAVVSSDCLILCPPPPADWESRSEELPALAPGTYRLELIEDHLPAGESTRLLYRGEVETLGSEALVRGGRFEIAIELDDGAETPQLVMPPTEDSALFYFFSADNWEAMVKVLDGCAINQHFWVFAAASTDVGYTLRVTDRGSGGVREYSHAAGSPAPALTDVEAFPCD